MVAYVAVDWLLWRCSGAPAGAERMVIERAAALLRRPAVAHVSQSSASRRRSALRLTACLRIDLSEWMATKMMSRKRIGWAAAAFAGVAVALVDLVPQTQWRLHVLGLSFAGKLPDIELREVVEFMLPGSDQSLAFLADTRNPYATIKNARTSADDVEAGVGCSGIFARLVTGRTAAAGRSRRH